MHIKLHSEEIERGRRPRPAVRNPRHRSPPIVRQHFHSLKCGLPLLTDWSPTSLLPHCRRSKPRRRSRPVGYHQKSAPSSIIHALSFLAALLRRAKPGLRRLVSRRHFLILPDMREVLQVCYNSLS